MASKKEKPVVLMVEDDKYIARAFRYGLENAGFTTVSAYDGEEALEQLRKVNPDIILLDVILPKKNGFEVMEEIRKDPKFKKIPVIILSNVGEDDEVSRGIEMGAKEYLIKANFSMEEVIDRIKKYIR